MMEIKNDNVITFKPTFSTSDKGFTPKPEGGGSPEPVPLPADYEPLLNKPRINGNVLIGDKTSEDLGIECDIETITVNNETVDIVNKNINLTIPEHENMSFASIKDAWDSIFRGE